MGTRTRRWLRRLAGTGLGGLALLAVVGSWAWRSPPFFTGPTPDALPAPILSREDYDRVHATHARPYVVEASRGPGGVLLYGASHTRDPRDPQIADLARRFAAFAPTVALVEGRLGFLLPGLMDPVRSFGEGGAVNALARERGIPVYTWEPPRERELSLVLARHPREHVALYYVLRPYVGSLRHGRPADPDAVVEPTRRRRMRWPGIEGTLPDMAAIDALWQRDFARFPDWRDTSDEHGWPGGLEAIARAANAARDEHFVRVILALAGRGERVFAVAGSSHAVVLEPALRAGLGPAP